MRLDVIFGVVCLMIALNNPVVGVLVFFVGMKLHGIFLESELRKKVEERMRELCLAQKNLADTRPLPGPSTLLGFVQQITDRLEPNAESLRALVIFGCRLSLCDSGGRVLIDLEPSEAKPGYIIEEGLFGEDQDFEFPGERRGLKDRIGLYSFWRTAEAVCFKSVNETELTWPEFIIYFNKTTLEPICLGKLLVTEQSWLIYHVLWGVGGAFVLLRK